MVVTDRFTTVEVEQRVVLAPKAEHVFEAYTDIHRLLRHERWLVTSSTVNAFLYTDLWAKCGKNQDAGSLIRHRSEQDPLWFQKFIRAAISEKGWWLIPQAFLFRRFRSLGRQRPAKQVLLFPVAFVAFLIDLIVFYQANRELHRGGGLGYWGKQEANSDPASAR
jgi:hypothetical protein